MESAGPAIDSPRALQRSLSSRALQRSQADADKVQMARVLTVKPVVALLASELPGERTVAANTIRTLAQDANHRAALVTAGAAKPLVGLLRAERSERERCEAAGALRNLAVLPENRPLLVHAGAVEALSAAMRLPPGGSELREQCAAAIRNIALTDEYRKPIARAGVIEFLVKMLAGDDPALALEREQAAGALRNICAHSASTSRVATKAKCVDLLLDMLDSENPGEREQAAGALWSVALNCAEQQVAIANAGAVPPLVQMLTQRHTHGEVTAATGALSNLRGCGHVEAPPHAHHSSLLLPHLPGACKLSALAAKTHGSRASTMFLPPVLTTPNAADQDPICRARTVK